MGDLNHGAADRYESWEEVGLECQGYLGTIK